MHRLVMRTRRAVAVGVLLVAAPGHAAQDNAALQAALRQHVTVLASDEFEGREPGTAGEDKTLRYLAREWFAMGLTSGTNDPGHPWFAPVELVQRVPEQSSASFARAGRVLTAAPRDALVITSSERNLLRDAPLLFVGHGLGTYPRHELTGRIAVMLDSLPAKSQSGYRPQRQKQLLDAGAAAVLTILDSGRGLDDVAEHRRRAGYALAGEGLGGDLEAYVTRAYAARIFGQGVAEMVASAARPGFVPQPLPITGTLEATTRETRIRTHNVIARLPGRRPQSGAVLFVAHWDHFGRCATPPAEDLICNGAVDNASGVAMLIEISRALSKGKRLDRDVYFLATTGEELGLLGAHAFAANPPVPLDRIVAAFNIDSPALARPGQPLSIVGAGRTRLDAAIARVARARKRRLIVSPLAEQYLERQDGWALLQHDVPAVMVASTYSDPERLARFMETTYHRPSDEAGAQLDLAGAADDTLFHIALARWFADRGDYPAKLR